MQLSVEKAGTGKLHRGVERWSAPLVQLIEGLLKAFHALQRELWIAVAGKRCPQEDFAAVDGGLQ